MDNIRDNKKRQNDVIDVSATIPQQKYDQLLTDIRGRG